MSESKTVGSITSFVLKHVSFLIITALIMLLVIFAFSVLQWSSLASAKRELMEQSEFLKQQKLQYNYIQSELPSLNIKYETELQKFKATKIAADEALDQLSNLKNSLSEQQKEYENLLNENKQLKDKNLSLTKQNDEYKKLNDQISKNRKELELLNNNLKKLKSSQEDAEDQFNELADKNSKLEKDIKAKELDLYKLNQSKDKSLSEKGALEAKVIALNKELEALVQDKSKLNQFHDKLESKLDALLAKDKELLSIIDVIKQGKESLKSGIAEIDDIRKSFSEQFNIAQKNLNDFNKFIDKTQKNFDAGNQSISDSSSKLIELIEGYNFKLQQLQKIMQNNQAEFENFQKELAAKSEALAVQKK